MENVMKIVDFSKCKECKYYEVEDYNEPCHECLNTFEMANSHTPLNFDKREDDNNGRKTEANQRIIFGKRKA